ncbi:hypothetical protein [Methylobacterium sp. A54F]
MPYIVSAAYRAGTVTYRCPTPEWALKKARDFERVGYTGMTITGPSGKKLTLARLTAKVEGASSRATTPAPTNAS